MKQTKIIIGDSVFVDLADKWDSAAERGMTNTPFQAYAYQKAWWDNLQPEGATLTAITWEHENNELAAIACLYKMLDGVVHFNGCVEETDYLDLICQAELAEEAWTAVFNTLCGPEYPGWTVLDLCNIPAASPTRNILPQLAHKNGLRFNESRQEVCPVIQLPNSFNEYLDQLDSKQRREVKRKLRRAHAAGVEISLLEDKDDLEQSVADFLHLLQESTFEKRDWLNEGRRAVFHEVAASSLAASTLQLMFAEVEGQKAAGLFNFDYDGRIWVYNSGLNPGAYGSLSLGVVLTAKAIEKAIADGRSQFDFLRGNETYKYRFGAKDTEIFRITIARDA